MERAEAPGPEKAGGGLQLVDREPGGRSGVGGRAEVARARGGALPVLVAVRQ
jgi:hypothetical protein